MATTPELPEWTGGKLANGEFLGYSKAIYGVLCNLDKTALPIGEPLAQLEAANLRLTDFINVFNEVSPSEASAAAANGVAGVIKQYKLVISSHAGKKEEPEPEPNTESAAQG